jgi:hypothetical protein
MQTSERGYLRRLSPIQNAAVRLVIGPRRCDHIAPGLRQQHCGHGTAAACGLWSLCMRGLHWRGLVRRSLSGDAPPHLADNCRLITDVFQDSCAQWMHGGDLHERATVWLQPQLCRHIVTQPADNLRQPGVSFNLFTDTPRRRTAPPIEQYWAAWG